jgi:cytochrome c551/c552
VDQLLEETIMKKLAIIAFAAFASSAFATQPFFWGGSGGGSQNGPCETCPQIDIKGPSVQTVSATFSTFGNEGYNGGNAQQNVSSNSGNVLVTAPSTQTTTAFGAAVTNKADGNNAYASQNLSSNVGKVNIASMSMQTTALTSSVVFNKAGANSKAVQNLATNNGCVACK